MPQPTPAQQATPMPRPIPAQQVTPAPQTKEEKKKEKKKEQKEQKVQQEKPEKPKKKKGGCLIALVLILLFLAAAIAGGYFFCDQVLERDPVEVVLELFDKINPSGGDEQDKDNSESGNADGEAATKVDATVLEPADELTAQAKKQLKAGAYAGSDGAMDIAAQALTMYMQVAEENKLEAKAKSGVEDAFKIYSDAVIKYCDTIKQQGAYVECFNEINGRLTEAMGIAATAVQKGYEPDGKALEAYKANLIPEFRDQFISEINAFTKRENWSRDEAWSCAERAYAIQEDGKPLLFDNTDPEDPLRMRYEYCLAWITRKRCETGVKDGTMTAAAAANSMVAILKDTDYNLLLLQDIVNYGKTAGMDVTKYSNAYNAIVNQLRTSQGLTVSADIAVNSMNSVKPTHFWYFNDLSGEDKYKVDPNNGTTAATRQWIRDNVPGIVQ